MLRPAATYLLLRTLRNRARRLLRQLRSPRYVVALLVGLGYLVLLFTGGREHHGTSAPAPLLESAGIVVLVVFVLKWWLFGADRLALAFTPAEIQFLFPAPVSRAALLGYKLARAQLLILLNVFIWAVFLRAGAESPPGALLHAGSLWLAFSTISLHRLGVALTRDAVLEHGVAGLRRAVLPLLVLGLVATAAWLTYQRFEATSTEPFAFSNEFLATPPLGWVLWPFRLPLLPFGAASVADWLPRAGVALGVVLLHVWWIFRADRGFEEAAVEASVRRAERLERWRKQGRGSRGLEPTRRRWLRLAPAGSPVLALAWKNLARLFRTASPMMALLAALLFVVGLLWGYVDRERDALILTLTGTLAVSWAGVLLLFGPLWIRADLRGDLDHLALLRTWPLPGYLLIAGQVLGSALVLTLLEALLGAVAILVVGALPSSQLPAATWAAGAAAALPALFLVNALAVGLQNAGAVLYPNWVQLEVRPGGIEAMGQQLLSGGLSILLLGLLLAAPAALGAGLWYLLADRLGTWAMLPALIPFTLGLALELFVLLDWLGARFERLDPSLA